MMAADQYENVPHAKLIDFIWSLLVNEEQWYQNPIVYKLLTSNNFKDVMANTNSFTASDKQVKRGANIFLIIRMLRRKIE